MTSACRAPRTLIAPALLFVAFASGAKGADIPETIHQKYVMGATSIDMPAAAVRIPLSGTDWYGHYRSPYVKVFVNGRGPFTFLFDTGAAATILDPNVVEAARVAVVSAVPGHHAVARANSIRVGGISMRDYYAVVAGGNDVDGILGFNSFGKSFLTFDLANRALIVSRNPVPLAGAFWLPYRLTKRLPTIDLVAEGLPLPTLIDTGDDAYAWEGTSNDLKGLTFDHAPVPAATVFNGQTGATTTTITSVDGSLRLGPVHADRPAVAINESLPLPDVGVGVIEQFVMEFDRIHGRVGFAPRFTGANFRVPGTLTAGFSISFRRPVRLVRGVLPGMAPDRAGMRPGDVVARVNGRSSPSIGYEYWDRLLSKRRPVTIAWKHGGGIMSRTFPVVEMR